jgi:hypothetical protein
MLVSTTAGAADRSRKNLAQSVAGPRQGRGYGAQRERLALGARALYIDIIFAQFARTAAWPRERCPASAPNSAKR